VTESVFEFDKKDAAADVAADSVADIVEEEGEVRALIIDVDIDVVEEEEIFEGDRGLVVVEEETEEEDDDKEEEEEEDDDVDDDERTDTVPSGLFQG